MKTLRRPGTLHMTSYHLPSTFHINGVTGTIGSHKIVLRVRFPPFKWLASSLCMYYLTGLDMDMIIIPTLLWSDGSLRNQETHPGLKLRYPNSTTLPHPLSDGRKGFLHCSRKVKEKATAFINWMTMKLMRKPSISIYHVYISKPLLIWLTKVWKRTIIKYSFFLA